MPYGKKKAATKSTFKTCKGCTSPAACSKAKACKGKKK